MQQYQYQPFTNYTIDWAFSFNKSLFLPNELLFFNRIRSSTWNVLLSLFEFQFRFKLNNNKKKQPKRNKTGSQSFGIKSNGEMCYTNRLWSNWIFFLVYTILFVLLFVVAKCIKESKNKTIIYTRRTQHVYNNNNNT